MKTHRYGLLCAAVMAILVASAAQNIKKSSSDAAFEQLASLAGEWRGVHDETRIGLKYTLTANGTALMEEFQPVNKPKMITMFYVDGDHLVATHYCSAGNQPQMTTGAIIGPIGRSLVFSLVRITGMRTPGDWHNTGVTLAMEDEDHLTQTWTWEYLGKKGSTRFTFTRRK